MIYEPDKDPRDYSAGHVRSLTHFAHYIHDEVASVAVPVKELPGFARVNLAPGETKTVSFTLRQRDLALWDRAMRFVVEPGMFDIMIGSSSEDIRLRGRLNVSVGHECGRA